MELKPGDLQDPSAPVVMMIGAITMDSMEVCRYDDTQWASTVGYISHSMSARRLFRGSRPLLLFVRAQCLKVREVGMTKVMSIVQTLGSFLGLVISHGLQKSL